MHAEGFRGEVPESIDIYNLDAIIAVGYRVSSLKATRFRQWATKEHISYRRGRTRLKDDTAFRHEVGEELFARQVNRQPS